MSHNAVNEEAMKALQADNAGSPVSDPEALEQVSAALVETADRTADLSKAVAERAARLRQLAAAARTRSDVAVLAAQQAAKAARTTAAARLAARANAEEKSETDETSSEGSSRRRVSLALLIATVVATLAAVAAFIRKRQNARSAEPDVSNDEFVEVTVEPVIGVEEVIDLTTDLDRAAEVRTTE